MKLFLIILILYGLTGCRKPNEQEKKESGEISPDQKSSTETFIDGVTGRTAVRAGKKARETLEKVSAEHQKNLEEILGE
ncbi:hypothetical protein ACFLS1_00045 [Verrucomicrobiota bacterium]